MKTKAKLTLAISTLSAVVLAAGVTSTFAWFTTQSTVNATTGELVVNSPATLKIAGAKVRGNDIVGGSTNDYHIEGGGGKLGAVSSVDGAKFYAPEELEGDMASYAAADYEEIGPEETGNGYVDYFQYNLAVTAAKGEAGRKLQYSITVTEPNAQGNLINWYRVAIYYVDTAESATDKAAAKTGQQALATDAGNKVYAHTAGTDNAYYKNDQSVITTKANTVYAVSTASDVHCASAFSTSAEKNMTANFVVAVWMEGTAADTTQNVAANEKIKVTVEFELYTPTPNP